jgi:hypothetical protein
MTPADFTLAMTGIEGWTIAQKDERYIQLDEVYRRGQDALFIWVVSNTMSPALILKNRASAIRVVL